MQQTQAQVAANYANGMFAYGYEEYAWPDPSAAAMGAGTSGMHDVRKKKKSNNGNLHGVEPAWNYYM